MSDVLFCELLESRRLFNTVVQEDGNVLRVIGDAEGNIVEVYFNGGGTFSITETISRVVIGGPYTVGEFDRVRVKLKGGDDELRIDDINTPVLAETGSGADTVTSNAIQTEINLGPGADTASSSGGIVSGKGGADDITMSEGFVFGGKGNDIIDSDGVGGDDPPKLVIFGEGGNDFLKGGGGNDFIFGGPGDDTIYGLSGNDKLFGNEGIDSIFGKSEGDNDPVPNDDDDIWGGTGVDVIDAGPGVNSVKNGEAKNITSRILTQKNKARDLADGF